MDYKKFWAESMNLNASTTYEPPAELVVGDRVADVYADSLGTVTGFEGGNGVVVKWDDHQPEDDQLPLPERSDLRRL